MERHSWWLLCLGSLQGVSVQGPEMVSGVESARRSAPKDRRGMFRAMCEDGLGPARLSVEERAKLKAFHVKYGVSEEAADREIDREQSQDFRDKGREYHTAYASLLSFSFGTVDKAGG